MPLAIVGAGAAGLAAALGAARAGVRPLLLDEWPAPGGQLRHCLAPVSGGRRGVDLAPFLASRARAAGVELLAGTTAWGLFPGNELGVVRQLPDSAGAGHEETAVLLQAERLILATGATDATRSFPGWTLPGVMLAGAVERAIALHHVLPGERFLVAGDGPLAARAAATITAGGGVVVTTVAGTAIRAAYGAARVERVTITQPAGDTTDLAVDSICLALGRDPDYALGLQLGIALDYDTARGVHLPLRDPIGLTSAPDLYIAGEAAGATDLAAALLDGMRVGLAAAGGDPATAPALLAELLAAYPVESTARAC